MKLTLEIEIAFRYEKKKPSGKENSQLTPDKKMRKRKYYDGKEGKKLRKMISRFPFGTTDCDKLKRKFLQHIQVQTTGSYTPAPFTVTLESFLHLHSTRLRSHMRLSTTSLSPVWWTKYDMAWPVLAISFNVSMTPRTSSAQVAHRCVASARLAILHQQLFL